MKIAGHETHPAADDDLRARPIPGLPDVLDGPWVWIRRPGDRRERNDGSPLIVEVCPSSASPGFTHYWIYESGTAAHSKQPIRHEYLALALEDHNIQWSRGAWKRNEGRSFFPPEGEARRAAPPPEPSPPPPPPSASEPAHSPGDKGLVYFLRAVNGGPVKIGFTSRAAAGRMAEIQPAYPYELRALATIPGTYADEYALHRRFAHIRLRGEWFDAADDLLAFIASRAKEGAR